MHYASMDDKELLETFKSNNEGLANDAFEEIYNRYYKLVDFVILKYINNKSDIEELRDDAFVLLYNNRNKIESTLKYYLITIANNVTKNYIVKRKLNVFVDTNYVLSVAEETTDNCTMEYGEIISEMRKVLSEQEVEIIVNHIVYEMPFKDLAILYDLSINTVMSKYSRALKKLRGRIKNEKKREDSYRFSR